MQADASTLAKSQPASRGPSVSPGKVLAPLALLPVWLARSRGRALRRSAAAAATLSGALTAWLLLLGGPEALPKMLDAMSFQLGRGGVHSAWALLGTSASSRPRCSPASSGRTLAARDIGDDPRRLAAAQLAASNWSYLHAV